MQYAELRCYSYFSFLRGSSSPRDLILRASELGLFALGITDRDGVYGIPQAYKASQECPSLKLIVGTDLSLGALPRLTLLARNRKAYGVMCRLITASHEGKEKGKAALEWQKLLSLLDLPGAEGLVAIPEEGSRYEELKEIFQDRLYLPLHRVLDGRDRQRTQKVLETSRRLEIPIVATNDAHYHSLERRRLQDILSAIRENESLSLMGSRVFSNAERYLKSPRQMARLFRDLPEALMNTLKIAESCTFSPSELRYRYPSEWIPQGETAQGYLSALVWKGAQGRYPEGVPEKVKSQIEHELKLIEQLQFADYFLTIWEVVAFARSRKILCQGRGSAANSVVCYCLEITSIDPVRMNLLFERFISVERGEPPDIDVDFEHERREEVIQHIYEKYGRDRAGMVAAVITYRSKSAFRDVSKALGVAPEHPSVEPFIEEIRGFPRHLSIHSGGFTLSADPIIETVPIEPARMEGRTIVQWDKEDLAIIGLLKVDILALGMLTAIRKSFDLIRPRADLTIATVPADDRPTYEMIQKADTAGTFQIESRAQMSMLGRLLPENFYDLVVQVAIVRPGPIMGQMVHPYLRRRRGQESSQSPDPRLEPILGKTLGVPLFQEQVMRMAILMGGFTPGEADELRRAIGAWRSSGTIEKLGKKLMEGLLKNGLPQDFVDRIFLQIRGFSEYGFPESHAASFALLAYVSAYLKCHYPAEFTCALLNSQAMGFYAPHTLVDVAKRHGVSVFPIDPRYSEWDSILENGGIRIGFSVVNGMSQSEAQRVIDARRVRVFSNFSDFLWRTRLSGRVLQTLAMGDAFSCFKRPQREALWEILRYQILQESLAQPQLSLFHGVEMGEESAQAQFGTLSPYESIRADYQSYGLSVRGHPMQYLRGSSTTTTQTIKRAMPGRVARVSGMVIARQRPGTAKGTVFATLEDEEGFLDLILHKETFEKYEEVFVSTPFLKVTGILQRDTNTVNLIVQRVERIRTEEVRVGSRDFH